MFDVAFAPSSSSRGRSKCAVETWLAAEGTTTASGDGRLFRQGEEVVLVLSLLDHFDGCC